MKVSLTNKNSKYIIIRNLYNKGIEEKSKLLRFYRDLRMVEVRKVIKWLNMASELRTETYCLGYDGCIRYSDRLSMNHFSSVVDKTYIVRYKVNLGVVTRSFALVPEK